MSLDLKQLARLVPGGFAKYYSRGASMNPPHLQLIDQKLMAVAAGQINRLAVLMPPRHGKSERISRTFPAWFLGNWPDKRVILSSYEADFAADWGRKARDLLLQHGPALWGVRVAAGASAANRWTLDGHAGGMVTAGVGGPITGKGADLFIIDDPVKNAEEASSEVYREKAWEWYRSTAYTRLEPGGAIVLIQTRWHEDDLAGRILREAAGGGEKWEVINLPAFAERDDPLGRAIDEPLWPERFDTPALTAIKQTLGGYLFAAMYQGRPTPEGGGLFRKDWLRYYDVEAEGWSRLSPTDRRPIASMMRFCTVDLACSTKTTADYTAIATWASTYDGYLLLLDLDRRRLEGPQILPAIQTALDKWEAGFVGIESGGFQLSLVQAAWAAGMPARELKPDKDKVSRAIPATARMEAGRVLLPRGAPWLPDFEGEILSFPGGAHDECVDVLSYAVEAARQYQAMDSRGIASALPAPEEDIESEDERDSARPWLDNRPASRLRMRWGDGRR